MSKGLLSHRWYEERDFVALVWEVAAGIPHSEQVRWGPRLPHHWGTMHLDSEPRKWRAALLRGFWEVRQGYPIRNKSDGDPDCRTIGRRRILIQNADDFVIRRQYADGVAIRKTKTDVATRLLRSLRHNRFFVRWASGECEGLIARFRARSHRGRLPVAEDGDPPLAHYLIYHFCINDKPNGGSLYSASVGAEPRKLIPNP